MEDQLYQMGGGGQRHVACLSPDTLPKFGEIDHGVIKTRTSFCRDPMFSESNELTAGMKGEQYFN